jgi:hypothetical protein
LRFPDCCVSFAVRRVVAGLIVAGPFAISQNVDPLRTPVGGPATSPAAPPAVAGSPAARPAERLREGTRLIDVTGAFQSVGADSVSFLANGNKDRTACLRTCPAAGQSIVGRESNTAAVDRERNDHRISRANYLLVTKAVIQLPDGEPAANLNCDGLGRL